MHNNYGRVRIILGNGSLANYPQGGGHWMVRLQYLLGLQDLGHDVFLISLLWSTGKKDQDLGLIKTFFRRFKHYGLQEKCILIYFEKGSDEQNLTHSTIYGMARRQLNEIIRDADLFWNDCCHIRQPLLGRFRNPVLIDLDPGHLQVSAMTVDMDIFEHRTFLSVGKKLNDPDCEVPALGIRWHTFTPFVYLPMWKHTVAPPKNTSFSSITHWGWGELWLNQRVLSISKRDAYLRYLELPKRTGRAFELAANIHPKDQTGDHELLESHGWKIIDPWKVAGSPSDYQDFIVNSSAEISCPKPIFRELKTGWFSDRSVCYLASGRPVLAEDTGCSDYLPSDKGLLFFTDLEEAVAGVSDIDAHYIQHTKAAREIAEDFFDSRKCLTNMLNACI